MLPRLIGASTRAARPDVEHTIRGLILSNSTETIGAAGAVNFGSLTFNSPAIVTITEDDNVITPPAASEEIARGIAGAELAIVPKAGHMSNMEQPAAFNLALARFLEHRV